jgi:hypothetical protein
MSRNLHVKKVWELHAVSRMSAVTEKLAWGLQLAVQGSEIRNLCFISPLIRYNLLTDIISFSVTQPALQRSSKELFLMTSTFFELENISHHNPEATENTGLKQK